jgi:phospholipid/cholesterol/gamma-HCH transport system permease protein
MSDGPGRTTAGELSTSRSTEGVLLVRLAGRWRLADDLPSPAKVREEVERAGGVRRLAFDTSGVTEWDSGLLTFLRRVIRDSTTRRVEADRTGLPDGVRRLLDLADAVPEKETKRSAGPTPFLVRVGTQALAGLDGAREFIAFLGEATLAFLRLLRGKARFPWSDFWLVVQECGANALPIVSLVSVLVGLILAFMGAIQLSQFGAQIYVADLVGIGMARDMGAIMVGIIMAGRTGAAFAAQLGTMTVNEEIDALQTMGISAMEYLVLPRMLALMLMMPLLSLYADVVGIIGGLIVGISALDVGMMQYLEETRQALSIKHFAAGLFKGSVYGVIVALSGCLRGMQCGRSAAAVGSATTSAVVMGIVLIIVSCGIITIVYDVLGI